MHKNLFEHYYTNQTCNRQYLFLFDLPSFFMTRRRKKSEVIKNDGAVPFQWEYE